MFKSFFQLGFYEGQYGCRFRTGGGFGEVVDEYFKPMDISQHPEGANTRLRLQDPQGILSIRIFDFEKDSMKTYYNESPPKRCELILPAEEAGKSGFMFVNKRVRV